MNIAELGILNEKKLQDVSEVKKQTWERYNQNKIEVLNIKISSLTDQLSRSQAESQEKDKQLKLLGDECDALRRQLESSIRHNKLL